MTVSQYKAFRICFKEIVSLKAQVRDSKQRLSRLSYFDIAGSHKKSIEREIALKSKLSIEYAQLLRGNAYEQWLAISGNISVITSQLNANGIQGKLNAAKKFEELNIDKFVSK